MAFYGGLTYPATQLTIASDSSFPGLPVQTSIGTRFSGPCAQLQLEPSMGPWKGAGLGPGQPCLGGLSLGSIVTPT